jgi:hypothetical protein
MVVGIGLVSQRTLQEFQVAKLVLETVLELLQSEAAFSVEHRSNDFKDSIQRESPPLPGER